MFTSFLLSRTRSNAEKNGLTVLETDFSFSGFQRKPRNFCYNASHDLQPQLIPSIYISILRQYDAILMDLITRRETETDPRCF